VSHRKRSTWLASAGALVLVLTFAGLAAGRVILTEETPTAPEVTTPDTTASFEDVNGNGIDDDCEEAGTVQADQAAVDAALKAADLDADGVISVSEAARSGWAGGKNCNHGGYVSWVAHGTPATTTTEAAAPDATKKDHAAEKAAKEAAKTERATAKAAAKAEKRAAHDAAKAAKNLAKGKTR
jgi:hypothetical protein